jgi:hypothetical protein
MTREKEVDRRTETEEKAESTTLNRRNCLRGVLAAGGVLGLGTAGLSTSAVAQDGEFAVTPLTNPDLTPQTLAELLAADGDGVEISSGSVAYDGAPEAGGTFEGGEGIVGFSDGIVLSSGSAEDVVGPNDSSNTSTGLGTDGDDALSELAGGDTNDATILEFEFTVPEGIENVAFDYVFGSEEYNEYVGSGFNDVFAFYVNGDNCAVIENPEDPDDVSPVSINTVNNGRPSVEPTNSEQYVNNDPFTADADGEPVPEDELRNTEMDGFTTVLTCNAPVDPGETNTMRLAIADTGDSIYDSWVLLQAGSLTVCPDTGDASVSFADQTSDGNSVTVDSVSLENGGYVVVHGPDGAVLGNSAYLDPGTHENVEVTLDSQLPEGETSLTAMAHTDDGDQSYEFPDADGPYVGGKSCDPVVDQAQVTVAGKGELTASVTFDDQDSGGSSVVVQNATLSDGGYLVIHEESDGAPGAVIGHSAYLDSGTHENVEVTLDDPIASTQTLIAMAHTDDGDQEYEFPDADGPYTADGAPVVDDACITLVC